MWPSPGAAEEFLADGIRGLTAELLPQPDFRADHEKTQVDVVPQIVHDELRRRPRPLQLIGQQSIKQDALGAIRVGARYWEPFFLCINDVPWEAFDRDGFQRPCALTVPELDVSTTATRNSSARMCSTRRSR